MKKCEKCGVTYDDNVKFCDKCGSALVNAPQQAAPQQAAPQQAAPQQAAYQPTSAQPPVYTPVADPSDHTAEFDAKDISENKVIALCPYIFSVLGVLVALLASKESKYVAFHVRQALKIYVVMGISSFLTIIPFVGWLAMAVIYIICFVAIIIEFFSVCGGKAKEAPVIKNFDFLK